MALQFIPPVVGTTAMASRGGDGDGLVQCLPRAYQRRARPRPPRTRWHGPRTRTKSRGARGT